MDLASGLLKFLSKLLRFDTALRTDVKLFCNSFGHGTKQSYLLVGIGILMLQSFYVSTEDY